MRRAGDRPASEEYSRIEVASTPDVEALGVASYSRTPDGATRDAKAGDDNENKSRSPRRPPLERQESIADKLAKTLPFFNISTNDDPWECEEKTTQYLSHRYMLKETKQSTKGSTDFHSPHLSGEPHSFDSTKGSVLSVENKGFKKKPALGVLTSITRSLITTGKLPTVKRVPLQAHSSFDASCLGGVDNFALSSPRVFTVPCSDTGSTIAASVASAERSPSFLPKIEEGTGGDEIEAIDYSGPVTFHSSTERVHLQRPTSITEGTQAIKRRQVKENVYSPMTTNISIDFFDYTDDIPPEISSGGGNNLQPSVAYVSATPKTEYSGYPAFIKLNAGDGSLNETAKRRALAVIEPRTYPGLPDRAPIDTPMTPFPYDFIAGAKKRISSVSDDLKPRDRFLERIVDLGLPKSQHVAGQGILKCCCIPSRQPAKEIGDTKISRPYFTYWITFVHVLIMAIILFSHRIHDIHLGNEVAYINGVQDVFLLTKQLTFYKTGNVWIGPSLADLVKLGAKYSPCIRRDKKLWKGIEERKIKEKKTGCCVLDKHLGCFQSSEIGCLDSIATFKKWRKESILVKSYSDSNLHSKMNKVKASPRQSTGVRLSGPVCGQDPNFCENPRPPLWPDDITEWPLCSKKSNNSVVPNYLTCKITARPCCIGIQGFCQIVSKDYCDALNGTYHSDRFLCSQVDCFSGTCGSLPFYPHQIVRLFTSLFVHAGIIPLIVTIIIHLWCMRSIETLIGSKGLAAAYFISGMGGNLASAIFVPYNVECGPNGALMCILGISIIEIFFYKDRIENFIRELCYHILLILVIFAAGFTPFIDNWANLFGLIYGILISNVFIYKTFAADDNDNKDRKIARLRKYNQIRLVSFAIMVLMTVLLSYLLASQVIEWEPLSYFNCWPFLTSYIANNACFNKGPVPVLLRPV